MVELPAPGRGAYDRSLSRAERDTQHRERLVRATAEIVLEGSPTVARIVARAGVGRSTFYEFFDAPEHVLLHIEQRVVSALQPALSSAFASAHTPLERVRACVRSFLNVLEARALEARVVLTKRAGDELLSAAGKLLLAAFTRVAQAAQSDGVSVLASGDELTLLAAAASVETLARRHLQGPPLREPTRAVTELVLRMLR
jgi:AcrR family transcriptional regulator